MRRWISAVLLLVLLAGACLGRADVTLVEKGMELGDSSVHWVETEGLPQETADTVNQLLRERPQASTLTYLLPVALTAARPLRLSWEAAMQGGILSCVYRIENNPAGASFLWETVCVDLETGEEIPLSALFADLEGAETWLETLLTDEILPELSAHLQHSEIWPLPERFGLDQAGITFFYPAERFSTLHGQAGTVSVSWMELRPWLELGEGSVLRRFGTVDALTPNAQALRGAVSGGSLPGIPAELGGSMSELAERFGLMADPDLFEGGRYVQLEDGRFRGVLLMTDALSGKDLSGSTLLGIRADRFGLWGLETGRTTQAQWRELLGEPDASVALDEARADAMRLLPGESDYYTCGSVRLRLHCGEDGVLCAVFLLPGT